MTQFVGRMPLPIWQETPPSLKIKVAELLDYRSQESLRLVSRSDKNIVDNSERFIAQVTIGEKIRLNRNEQAFMTVCFNNQKEKTLPIHHNWSHVADRFLRLCENPHHTVGVMLIKLHHIPKLLKAIRGRPVTPLKVMHLQFKSIDIWGEDELEESFFGFLKLIKPGATLQFSMVSISLEKLRRLYDTEHWKMSPGLDLMPDIDIPSLDKYYHFNSLRLIVKKMSAKDAKKLIQAFIHKPANTYKNHSTFFRIFNREFVDPAAILSSYDDELKKLITFERENDYDQIRVQSFPMANSDFVLLVKAAGTFFAGSVCRENALKEDFETPRVF